MSFILKPYEGFLSLEFMMNDSSFCSTYITTSFNLEKSNTDTITRISFTLPI